MSICDFGATGEGEDTEAVQAAIDAAGERGGVVVFPAGEWVTGTVRLRSGVTVELEPGAVWKGSDRLEAYPDVPAANQSRMDLVPWKAFLYAEGCENITLRGGGAFFPNGGADCFQNGQDNSPERPYGLHFVNCRNVTVRDVTMRDSAFWMQRYFNCDRVRLSGLHVWNHCNLNNDGVDIDGCREVVVSDCWIDSSDDALCFKTEGDFPCEDVVVTNCVLSSHASAFKLGTGAIGDYRNFAVSNLVIRPSRAEGMIHPLNAPAGLAGIDIASVDGGTIENILIQNVVIDGTETPIHLKLGERFSHAAGKELKAACPVAWMEMTPGAVRGIRIDQVRAVNGGPIGGVIAGYPEHPIEDVVLSRVRIDASIASEEEPSAEVDLKSNHYPCNRTYGTDLPAYGFYVQHVREFALHDVLFDPAEKDTRPACIFRDCEDLDLREVEFRSNGPEAVQFMDCSFADDEEE